MRLLYADLFALLIIAVSAVTWAQVIRKDFLEDERDKRAIDFGLFVRNLLLKSATASNVKANISRNVANLKTTTTPPRRRTTTTTTPVPFFFNKGPFRFPFDLSGPINNKFNNNAGAGGGFINFDYNDYGARQPVRNGRRRRPTTSTTTTTTTTTTTAPAIQRRPIPRRPYGLLGKQKVPYFDYYDDYDYNYDDDDTDASNTPSSTAAPTTPNTPAPRPQRPPTANRARAQGRIPQLRNRLVYQYRQPDDTSTNSSPTPAAAPTQDSNNNDNDLPAANNESEVETSANTNDNSDDVYDDNDVNAGADNNPNIEQENNDSSDNANPNTEPNSNTNNSNDDTNVPPTQNFNINPASPPFQGQFNGPFGFGNFAGSTGFQYPTFNDFNLQYQPPSSPNGYSVRYY